MASYRMGITMVVSDPLVRSSFRAGEAYLQATSQEYGKTEPSTSISPKFDLFTPKGEELMCYEMEKHRLRLSGSRSHK